VTGRIRSIEKKKIHLIGTRTRDLPACSVVPQPCYRDHSRAGQTILRTVHALSLVLDSFQHENSPNNGEFTDGENKMN
jgi:hypothetical protein